MFQEEHRLRVFENRVLMRIFGPKWVDVTGGWRKLHNDELHNLHSSPKVTQKIIRKSNQEDEIGKACSEEKSIL
jgi:hypothetical protein